jgi:transposase
MVIRLMVGERSVGQVAKGFVLSKRVERLWVTRAGVEAGERGGVTSGECEAAGHRSG